MTKAKAKAAAVEVEAVDDGPVDRPRVKRRLNIAADDTRDDDDLDEIVAAVNVLVAESPRCHGHVEGAPWPAPAVLGGTMLAARLHRRRNSPDGVASVGELGAVYVQRNDPDVAQLLRLGRYAPPAIG